MAQVTLKNITKVYNGDVTAVKDVNLDITDKEFMVIVGPSGCGKTTTLRMIAGLEEITGGTIAIGDTVVNDVDPKNRDIAMVFQNYALYPHMTVYQNMAFGLKLRKYPKAKIKEQVKAVSELLGIDDLLKRKPKQLSGGQRQRVALGRAIVRSPKAFLFDEPLSNLDAKLRLSMRGELKALHKRLQTTSIYVTHDQVEAMTLGDRICVMYESVIQQVAPPMEIYAKPANRFVAGFLGTPPMNFINGVIDFERDIPKLICGKNEILLTEKHKESLAAFRGKEVVLGVRPENLYPSPIQGQSRNSLSAVVDFIEPLGHLTGVHFTTDSGDKFVTNVNPQFQIDVADTVQMYIDLDFIHIFETGVTGQNILLMN